MNHTEENEQSDIGIRYEAAGFLKGIRLLIPSLLWPWDAFHSTKHKALRRKMSLGPLFLAVLASFLFTGQLLLFELDRMVLDGTIQLPPGIPVESLYPFMIGIAAISTAVAMIIQWLGVAAISYFMCLLMKQQPDFSLLLTLTAFSFVPLIPIYLIEAVLLAISPAEAIIFLTMSSTSIFLNLVVLIWPAFIQTFVLESLSDIDRKQAMFAAFMSFLVLLLLTLTGLLPA